MPIRNQSDIAAIEAIPLSERALPESSYAALVEASKRSPDGQALSFFLSADRLDEAHVWTYAELVADVTRATNLFAAPNREMGIGKVGQDIGHRTVGRDAKGGKDVGRARHVRHKLGVGPDVRLVEPVGRQEELSLIHI